MNMHLFLASANQVKADDMRKTFQERYGQTQTTVKDFLKTVDNKKWICDKRNFPSMIQSATTSGFELCVLQIECFQLQLPIIKSRDSFRAMLITKLI